MTQAHLIIALVVIAFLALFSPTRAFLSFLFGSNGPVLKVVLFIYALLFTVYKDHLLIIKNFAPRRIIFKTLEKD